jgi:membrane-associated protease RseP (regulator of RpoE activity)
LDIGAAGPIAGFVALIPFLVYGIAVARISSSPPQGSYLSFGEPLIFRAVEALLLPASSGELNLELHPAGWAAWFGLAITLLNMLPFSQLDGGHVAYAVFGKWHRRAAKPLLIGLAFMGILWPGWLLWTVIVLILGPEHPPLWDEAYPLDLRRKVIGWVALALFVLCFMPVPVEYVP